MALIDVPVNIRLRRPPFDVVTFLSDANHRIQDFIENRPIRISGFVPSDFDPVYQALESIVHENVAPGNSFCEWGSGFGVVAMLAAMLDFESCGIEIEDSLVQASRELAADFGLPVDFVTGSFVPAGGESIVDRLCSGEDAWLTGISDDAYDQLGLTVRDFDVIYAFPWPGEEHVIAALFDEFAATGALLLTFGHLNGVQIRRKVVRRR
ncbi:MAG: hypothetical protein R3C49_03595 [Planctomycetaceae bacterium]